MNKKVKIGSHGGNFTIVDKYFLTQGGQARIYINGNKLFKIYHDQKKTISLQKIQELSQITDPNVIVPKDLIYDIQTGDPIGFTSNYIDDVEPLLKLFTKTFKQYNNIDSTMIIELVKQLQLTTTNIHNSKCLISDFNELNILVKIEKLLIPYFIDVDSYQTPSFKSEAIMDSVRDRRVSKIINGHLTYNPDIESDWFSWGILSFFLYTNCHPFRGNHPKYKPNQKLQQFDDGISVFHKDVRMPPCTNDLSVIPKRHLDWFIDTFRDNHRSIPPLPDGIAPLAVPAAIITIKGNNQIEVKQLISYGNNINMVIQAMGVNYVITTKKIYADQKELMSGCEKVKKNLLVSSSDGTMIVASLSGTKVTFTELINKQIVGTIDSLDMIYKNNCIYTICNEKLIENSFITLGIKTVHKCIELENVSTISTKMYEGCVIQSLLGGYYLTLPYEKGKCFSKPISNLDGYRIIDCKAERYCVVFIGEKKGQYDRFILTFKKDFSEFSIRKQEDISYDGINMTCLENGLCLLLSSPNELEMFMNDKNITIIKDPPIDANMKLFNNSSGVFFTVNETIYIIKKK